MHMHRDISVCAIEHDELTAVLPLLEQCGHAAQPGAELVEWNSDEGGRSSSRRRLAAGRRSALRIEQHGSGARGSRRAAGRP